MTREEAINILDDFDVNFDGHTAEEVSEAFDMAFKALSQEPCEDAISREDKKHIDGFKYWCETNEENGTITIPKFVCDEIVKILDKLPSVTPKPKTGHCKDCKYFEYDSVARLDGIPLIVAHEICNKWGNGCKTEEDGYCFLFEPQESEE